jgi:hypothetical protein
MMPTPASSKAKGVSPDKEVHADKAWKWDRRMIGSEPSMRTNTRAAQYVTVLMVNTAGSLVLMAEAKTVSLHLAVSRSVRKLGGCL